MLIEPKRFDSGYKPEPALSQLAPFGEHAECSGGSPKRFLSPHGASPLIYTALA